MIFQGLDCCGFAEAVALPTGGHRLQRVPDALRPHLNPGAQSRVLRTASNEVRCVADDDAVEITVSALEGEVHAAPFAGAFDLNQQIVIGEQQRTIRIAPSERMAVLTDESCAGMPYARNVLRLICHGGGTLVVHNVSGVNVRPPAAEHLPSRRLLTYGTSITHGACSTRPYLSYARQLAWRLDADLINLGVGGSCHCEHEFADYIAGRDDWDVAVLALSVNMIGGGFTREQFYERVAYMLEQVTGSNPARPVFCVTIYPHFRDLFTTAEQHGGKAVPDTFREALREAAAACSNTNLHLFEGADILTSYAGLTGDMIHPSDFGMITMAENLATRIAPVLAT
jgi:lysophospholipase L1-like esterase